MKKFIGVLTSVAVFAILSVVFSACNAQFDGELSSLYITNLNISVKELNYSSSTNKETATITVGWTVSGSYDAVNVQIYNGANCGYNYDTSLPNTGVYIPGVPLEQPYEFHVTPKRNSLSGKTTIKPFIPKPPAVKNLSVIQNGASFDVSWTNPTQDEFYSRAETFVDVIDMTTKKIILKKNATDKSLSSISIPSNETERQKFTFGRKYKIGVKTIASAVGNNANSEIAWSDEITYLNPYSIPTADTENTYPVTITSGSSQYFVLSPMGSGKTVKLENVTNSSVFLVRANTSDASGNSVPSSRYLSSMFASGTVGGSSYIMDLSDMEMQSYKSENNDETYESDFERIDFLDPISTGGDYTVEFPSSLARAATGETVTVKNYKVGDTRTINCRLTESSYQSTPLSSTLQYKGEHCYVWAVDRYFTTGTATGNKVNKATCVELGESFEKCFSLVQNIFGEMEPGLNVSSGKWDEDAISETGDMVNIVLYDLYNDYSANQTGGTYGFFFGGDLYPKGATINNNLYLTNNGRYLHVDTALNLKNPKVAKSVILHEFQHLINFTRKGQTEPWYTEMLSMLCEDMMLGYLELEEKEGPQSRLARFNKYYSLDGFLNWNNEDSLPSYARAYALGAFLARKYDGADFVYKMTHSDNHEEDAILDAVQQYEPGATWETIFRDFGAEVASGRIFNTKKVSSEHVRDGYNYPMNAINLFSYKQHTDSALGPLYSTLSQGTIKNIYKYGFDVSKIIDKSASKNIQDLTLVFGGISDSNIKEYLVVVK